MAANGIVLPSAKKLKHDRSSHPGNFDLPPPTFDLDIWANNYEGMLETGRVSGRHD